jgi:5-formyltetrahydrofolate cyclo-ligase
MTGSEWQEANNKLISRAVELALLKSPSVIHTFYPQEGNNEPDTLQFIRNFRKSAPDVQFAFPRIVTGTPLLQHFMQEDSTGFIKNRWGIAEPDPVTSIEIKPSEIDLILIPLLAFDRQGYRVGYGGGYYDRFLANCREDALKVGLSFFPPIDRIADSNTYDIPLDFCITPDNIWEW